MLFAETLSAFLGILMLGKVFHEAIPASGFSRVIARLQRSSHVGGVLDTHRPFPRFKKNMTLEVSWIFSDLDACRLVS